MCNNVDFSKRKLFNGHDSIPSSQVTWKVRKNYHKIDPKRVFKIKPTKWLKIAQEQHINPMSYYRSFIVWLSSCLRPEIPFFYLKTFHNKNSFTNHWKQSNIDPSIKRAIISLSAKTSHRVISKSVRISQPKPNRLWQFFAHLAKVW